MNLRSAAAVSWTGSRKKALVSIWRSGPVQRAVHASTARWDGTRLLAFLTHLSRSATTRRGQQIPYRRGGGRRIPPFPLQDPTLEPPPQCHRALLQPDLRGPVRLLRPRPVPAPPPRALPHSPLRIARASRPVAAAQPRPLPSSPLGLRQLRRRGERVAAPSRASLHPGVPTPRPISRACAAVFLAVGCAPRAAVLRPCCRASILRPGTRNRRGTLLLPSASRRRRQHFSREDELSRGRQTSRVRPKPWNSQEGLRATAASEFRPRTPYIWGTGGFTGLRCGRP